MAPVMYPSLLPPYSFNNGGYQRNQNYLPVTLNSQVMKHMETSQDEYNVNLNTPDSEREMKKQVNELEDERCQPKTSKTSTPTNFTTLPMGPSDYAVSAGGLFT
jgi:ABC-type lipoprotein release transport system permease subunit